MSLPGFSGWRREKQTQPDDNPWDERTEKTFLITTKVPAATKNCAHPKDVVDGKIVLRLLLQCWPNKTKLVRFFCKILKILTFYWVPSAYLSPNYSLMEKSSPAADEQQTRFPRVQIIRFFNRLVTQNVWTLAECAKHWTTNSTSTTYPRVKNFRVVVVGLTFKIMLQMQGGVRFQRPHLNE